MARPKTEEEMNTPCFEVVLTRTVTQEHRVGVTCATEAEARKHVEGLEKLDNDAAWHKVKASAPKISEVVNKGPLVHKERKFGGHASMKSTGRPVE